MRSILLSLCIGIGTLLLATESAVAQPVPYDCALCEKTGPVEIGAFDWRGAIRVDYFEPCDEHEQGANWFCVLCDQYPFGEASCNEDADQSDFWPDSFYGISEEEVVDWFYQDGIGPDCDLHECFESGEELVAAVGAEDAMRVVALIEQAHGRIFVNRARSVIQAVNCRGEVAFQLDIFADLSRRVSELARLEINVALVSLGPAYATSR